MCLRKVALTFILFVGLEGKTEYSLAAPYGVGGIETTFDPALMQIEESKYLGGALDRAQVFLDETGQELTLADMLGKPVILLFSYYGCDGSCPIINTNVKQALQKVDRFTIGEDYRVITISFDEQDNIDDISAFVEKLGISAEFKQGWKHVIFKQENTTIDNFTRKLGYRYFWSKADQVFVHPNVIVFLTPEGRIARYLYGTAIDEREIEFALVDADWNRIANSSNIIDMLTGVCFSYNYGEGKYTFNYPLVIGLASLFFGLSLIIFSFVGVYRKSKPGRVSHV